MTDFDPADQLSLLTDKCKKLTPDIYRVYDCYLKSLRATISFAVKKAIFKLLTDYSLSFEDQFSDSSTHSLQVKIDTLINKCTSLLTIEHIISLSKEIDDENKEILEDAKQEIFEAIDRKNEGINDLEDLTFESIKLDSRLPLREYKDTDLRFLLPTEQTSVNIDYTDKNMASRLKNIEHPKVSFKNNGILNRKSGLLNKLEAFSSIFSKSREVIKKPLDQDNNTSNSQKKSFSKENELEEFFPNNPIEISLWMEDFDIALNRRLRNLSYSINIELLKEGYINTLLPVNLLDAVISGHIISLEAPSNVLKLRLPMKGEIADEGVDVLCILIKSSDLEFDEPNLRSNRSSIRNLSSALFKMVRKQRYWQNLQSTKAFQKQWLPSFHENPRKGAL